MVKPFRIFLSKLVLEEAIAFEELSYRFYETALHYMETSESRELIKRLLQEELKHRMRLEEMQEIGDLGQLEVSNEKESEDIETISCAWPDIPPMATREEIIEIAIMRERCAFDFYETMEKRSRLKVVSRVFSMLKKEEERHIRLLMEEMNR